LKQAKKAERHESLRELLLNNPFYTDEQLASELAVSVQTVRLDRAVMSIPELRTRVKAMATSVQAKPKAVEDTDIVGDIIDIEPGVSGISVMRVMPDMLVSRTGMAKGHYLFAQANTLALAVLNVPSALIGVANVKYLKPIHKDDRLVAKAQVIRQRANKYFVWVKIRNDQQEVFRAKFTVISLPAERAAK